MNSIVITPIARMCSDFPSKFGIPRQSGLVDELRSTIVFEPEFRNPDTLRGIEGYSHLWLIWQFSQAVRSNWSPTVRPPRLGGNARMGVFATRSPFRPNPLGLSCVELDRIDMEDPEGPVLYVKGADLMDGTPIYDIKPYVKYADSRPHAICGYVDRLQERSLKVVIPSECKEAISDKSVLPALVEVLALDPRPSYHDDPQRIYGLSFAGYNVRFSVAEGTLRVVEIK
jgi:tRNA-Thr(GGU) m(6)t(6)A37 methyltransferase TsaA